MVRQHGSTFLFSVRRAVAALVAAGLAIYLVEGLLGFDRVQRWKLPSGFDRRSRLEVLADLRRNGVAAIPLPSSHGYLRDRGDDTFVSAFTSEGREFLPLGGVRERTAVVCNENGKYLIAHPDQYGFNNRASVWTPWRGRDQVLTPVDDELRRAGLFSRGRFGAWKHEVSNQDHSVMQGVETIDHVLRGTPERTCYNLSSWWRASDM